MPNEDELKEQDSSFEPARDLEDHEVQCDEPGENSEFKDVDIDSIEFLAAQTLLEADKDTMLDWNNITSISEVSDSGFGVTFKNVVLQETFQYSDDYVVDFDDLRGRMHSSRIAAARLRSGNHN